MAYTRRSFIQAAGNGLGAAALGIPIIARAQSEPIRIGLVTVKTAMAVGVSPQRGMLALGVGDHMGNFLMPFWYVVVAGIARVDFRCFFGYGFLFAAIWFVVGILVFTFAPC